MGAFRGCYATNSTQKRNLSVLPRPGEDGRSGWGGYHGVDIFQWTVDADESKKEERQDYQTQPSETAQLSITILVLHDLVAAYDIFDRDDRVSSFSLVITPLISSALE